jgi:hypothetical protein
MQELASSGVPFVPPLLCTPEGCARCSRAAWMSLPILGPPVSSGDAVYPGPEKKKKKLFTVLGMGFVLASGVHF